jgi:flagellar basal body-associated protein FliL
MDASKHLEGDNMEEMEARELAKQRNLKRAAKRYEQNKMAIEKANEDLQRRISKRTLEILDSSMKNFKKGKVSDPIDI